MNEARSIFTRSQRAAAVGAIALSLAAGLLSPAQARGEDPDTWYAQRVTRSDAGVIVSHIWSKGRSLRADAVISGVPVVTLVSGEFYYVIDVLRNAGIAVRRSQTALEADRSRRDERPFGNEAAELLRRGAEPVREETLAGRPCTVLRLTDARGRQELWVTKDEAQLPLRIDGSDRGTGARVVADYVDWLSGIDLPDDFFTPDPRAKIERMEYQEYVERSSGAIVGPAPVLFADLLHGR